MAIQGDISQYLITQKNRKVMLKYVLVFLVLISSCSKKVEHINAKSDEKHIVLSDETIDSLINIGYIKGEGVYIYNNVKITVFAQ